MELMRMLLLCAFVVTLQEALGANGISNSDIKLNTSITDVNSATSRNRSHQVWNIAIPFYSMTTELQALFLTQPCKYCTNCMEKALAAQNNNSNSLSNHPSKNFFYDNLEQKENYQVRHNSKRSIRANNTNPKSDFNIIQSKVKSETVTVTKYANEEGKVYAIRVNEINNQIPGSSDVMPSCRVYSVKKSLPCQSGNSDLLLIKKKVKKSKKPKEKIVTTEKVRPVTAVYKKREARLDNSQAHVSESFMPSIEELY